MQLRIHTMNIDPSDFFPNIWTVLKQSDVIGKIQINQDKQYLQQLSGKLIYSENEINWHAVWLLLSGIID